MSQLGDSVACCHDRHVLYGRTRLGPCDLDWWRITNVDPGLSNPHQLLGSCTLLASHAEISNGEVEFPIRTFHFEQVLNHMPAQVLVRYT